ncbi:dehydrogenase [Sulfodiicoccus acidiphilus]|uniref:Dehydrogenase n=1 Tax=Sulfodiicoccus acidiphilus TaxID=1670455 RepID=A0A348B548_9CREN|nr:Gfo/Idh/MocA family oxidoreductase [Sulfodiicoccus acidiphilus]BBD73300.1 dehydrogenase [Sulfodiicoccus acidiphilus]GGT89273.1 dehydrogenase [Sulfodiicoccus acidiphilus]
MIRIGIIGCGGIANAHVLAYLQHSERVKIQALADVYVDAAEGLRRRFKLEAQVHHSYEELLKREDVDAVDIMLPHHLHWKAVMDAIMAGKHVLVEKPMCVTPAEADAVVDAVKAAKTKLLVGHNQVFSPAVREAKRMIEEGYVGKLFSVRTQDCFKGRIGGWRLSKEKIGGGELIDTGYHPMYLLSYLSASKVSSVYAVTGKFFNLEMEGEDTAMVLVNFADGSLGSVNTSWAYELPPGDKRFAVAGEKGLLYGDLLVLGYKVPGMGEARREWPTVRDPYTDTFIYEISHFLDVVEGRSEPIQGPEEGRSVVRLVTAAYRSVAEKRAVGLDEV